MSRPKLEDFAAQENITRLLGTIKELGGELKDERARVAELQRELGFIHEVSETPLTVPKWAQPKARHKGDHATACLLLSDTHFDEVVKPEEVDFINAYNRSIAEKRLHRTADKTIEMARDYLSGFTYDGLVVMLGGDLFSGSIHDELKETNEAPILASVLHWSERLVAILTTLADHFGNVHVAAVPGNHGRMAKRSRFKGRATDNFDWLVANLLRRHLKDDARFTWTIPAAMDAHIQVYNTHFALSHGDQQRGGDGITGMVLPVIKGHQKKFRRESSPLVGRPYDWMVIGHWHCYLVGRGVIVNGSLKGYDELAFGINAEPEPPQQAFWVVTPEHKVSFSAPILPMDRKAEGW